MSLGVRAGKVKPGALADFCSLGLDHPLLREVTAGDERSLSPERLLDLLAFTGAGGAVCAAWVNGRPAWKRPERTAPSGSQATA